MFSLNSQVAPGGTVDKVLALRATGPGSTPSRVFTFVFSFLIDV